ncbi:MAG: methyltransferase domain-containing protein [Ardenticatenaceae bacterium]|nr:methyltransferase domain-containing protein [Ardenticatenaceae bacterium]MCB9443291.1 methyltransferase domain-containing protein [Ardenticatenaceae bacterium]
MKRNSPFSGTLQAIYARWPAFALGYGGIVAALILIGISAQQGWIGLIPLTLALLLVLIYFFLAALWRIHQQFGRNGLTPHHVLFDMGRIRAADQFVIIDLGLRQQAIDLARRLTTGKAVVVDVYSPQWTPGRSLVRHRARMPHPPTDPRIRWQTGRIDLLPLPDKSVTAVILCQVISEFIQEGDQLQLLEEIYRILSENGRLLVAEEVQNRTNSLLMGPGVLQLKPVEHWRELLEKAGFRVRSEKDLQGIIHCFRADKPTYTEAQQLTLGLNL